MAVTPLMNLNLPIVQTTLGPAWAALLNQALTQVDEHDHSPGRGTKVTPQGLNINVDLDINFQDLVNTRSTRFASQPAVLAEPTDRNTIYVQGGNLFYNNDSGTPVQITTGGSVNAAGAGALTPLVPGAFPYTVTISDAQKIIFVDTTTTRQIILPAATVQMFFVVTDALGLANQNPITITPEGTNKIAGLNTARQLKTPWGAWGFISDGTENWAIV